MSITPPIATNPKHPLPAASKQEELPAMACQDRLMHIWIVGTLLLTAYLLILIMTSTFTERLPSAIGWFTQAVSPIIGSMLAKWVGVGKTENRVVRKPIFNAAVVLSIVYLSMIAASLVYVGSFIQVDAQSLSNPNYVGATDASIKHALVEQRLEALSDIGLLLGFLMAILACLITACFGGKTPSKTRP